jgi:hypothetical protein
MPNESLEILLAELRMSVPILPKPEGEEAWADHLARISRERVIAEIDESQYFSWLDLVPPVFQRGSQFCFTNGAGPFRLFWREPGGRFFSRQLTWDETRKFCDLSGASMPSRD